MKPRLRPPTVPWKVSSSVPHIGVTQPDVDGSAYVTFIGFFKTAGLDAAADSVAATIPAPEDFVEVSPCFRATVQLDGVKGGRQERSNKVRELQGWNANASSHYVVSNRDEKTITSS